MAPSARGELEITEAIQRLIDDGRPVHWKEVKGWWKDTGHPDDLLEANRVVLGILERRIDGDVDNASRIDGKVVIEKGTSVTARTVQGPAVIGRRAHVFATATRPRAHRLMVGDGCSIGIGE